MAYRVVGTRGDIAVIRSDSLVRVQVYAALAYGARGLYYYCWGHGIWNMPSNPEDNQGIGRGTPTPNYPGAFSQTYGSNITVILHINDVPCCWN